MTKRLQVSEKSLELNVGAEMLQQIRAWPGCHRALWLGFTQRRERFEGLDMLIHNMGPGAAFMLQFKAPSADSRVDYFYKFSINEKQHTVLERLASKHPRAVYYVFPLYSKWSKANRHAPDLCQDTWLVPISSVPLSSLPASTRADLRHKVDVERSHHGRVTVTFHSPEVIGDAINAREYFLERDSSLDLSTAGVPSEQLQEWVRRWDDGSRSVRFRNLRALYIPQE